MQLNAPGDVETDVLTCYLLLVSSIGSELDAARENTAITCHLRECR
jgi:hypothetical protein